MLHPGEKNALASSAATFRRPDSWAGAFRLPQINQILLATCGGPAIPEPSSSFLQHQHLLAGGLAHPSAVTHGQLYRKGDWPGTACTRNGHLSVTAIQRGLPTAEGAAPGPDRAVGDEAVVGTRGIALLSGP